MRDFMMAALPLVLVGLAMAVFFAGQANKKKNQEKESGRLKARGQLRSVSVIKSKVVGM